MRCPIRSANPNLANVVATIIVSAAMAVLMLLHTQSAVAHHSCSGTRIVNINPGDDLDATVNADSPTTATTFCVHGGTYTVNRTVWLGRGDKIEGEPGTLSNVGPATKPVPAVKVTAGANNVDQLIRVDGSNISVVWLDLSGATGRYSDGEPVAGTGSAIGAGSDAADFLARYLRVHNNDGAGITNMKGRVLDSEFFSNTEDTNFEGFIGSGIKGITEFEAARNFVHDEQGNGIWLDLGTDDPARTNGFWVHHNLIVMNGRAGIRYENSPPRLADGVHRSQPTALIEQNSVHANSYDTTRDSPRPISIRNSQNALVRDNVFGAATIAGERYPHNSQNVAVNAADAGSSKRTDLWNVDIVDNILNGETIIGCRLPDNVVYCARNSG